MDSQDQFDRLKAKFQPVLDFLEAQQIHIQAVNVQDDRLLVRAVAPSEDMRDRIVEQFQQIDPSSKQFHADIRIDSAENAPNTGQSTVQTGQSFSQDGELPR